MKAVSLSATKEKNVQEIDDDFCTFCLDDIDTDCLDQFSRCLHDAMIFKLEMFHDSLLNLSEHV